MREKPDFVSTNDKNVTPPAMITNMIINRATRQLLSRANASNTTQVVTDRTAASSQFIAKELQRQQKKSGMRDPLLIIHLTECAASVLSSKPQPVRKNNVRMFSIVGAMLAGGTTGVALAAASTNGQSIS